MRKFEQQMVIVNSPPILNLNKFTINMKIFSSFVFSFIFSINIGWSQNASTIFETDKQYIYEVNFIESSGDTMTNEKMIFTGNDETWILQKSQSMLTYNYFPDTIGLLKYTDLRAAFEKRKIKNLKKAQHKKSWANYTWIDKDETTGKIITDTSIWFHPPRCNQYGYHYLNAYPQVNFNQLKIGGKWARITLIASLYPKQPEFKGTREDQFEVTEKLTISFKGEELMDCWRIKVVSKHSNGTEGNAEFIFSTSYGFISMDFHFYNGVQINYKLKEIIGPTIKH